MLSRNVSFRVTRDPRLRNGRPNKIDYCVTKYKLKIAEICHTGFLNVSTFCIDGDVVGVGYWVISVKALSVVFECRVNTFLSV